MSIRITRPEPGEYAAFHEGYLEAVSHEFDGLAALERQQATLEMLGTLTPEQAGLRYADGKWSVKAVIGHMADAERVLAYRLLRIARGDQTPLPGFDEKRFAAESNADQRDVAALAGELVAVRAATLALVRSLEPPMLTRTGTVNEWTLSARALVFIIAGHVGHHFKLLRERYQIPIE